ncbi:hypothetical protein JCM11641_008051 [Rhodosporidiobolus odoratus]
MATNAKPSHLPVPSSHFPAPSPTPPSPSAFPSLGGHPSSPSSPTLPPTGIPSYAQHARRTLPPSKLPEGLSLPASALPKSEQPKERLQPSQNGKDSPYARPGQSAARGGIKGKKPISSRAGGVRAVSSSSSRAAASQSSTEESSGTEKKEPARRTVPGMPASMLPPPVPKKKNSHGRKPSDASSATGKSGGMTSSQSMGALASSSSSSSEAPALGKKRRASLRKVLPPNTSKLSALAPSFDFMPRSATSPNLSSAVSSSSAGEDSALSADESTFDSPAVELEAKQAVTPTTNQLTPSFKELSLSADAELEEGEIKEEAPPASSAAPSSAAPASPVLLSGKEKQDIKETVSSAGAQGDEFRAESFTAADQEGEAQAQGTSAAEQSAMPDKPVAAGSAEEPVAKKHEQKIVLEAGEERTDRSLASFLGSAFELPHEGQFAPLDLPGEVASQEEEPVQEQIAEEEIPGAVNESPITDLAYVEKKGWWSEDYQVTYTGPLSLSSASPAPNPEDAGPAAIEPANAEENLVLLQYPAWSPEATEKDDATLVKDAADPSLEAPAKLASYLATSFTTGTSPPTPAEKVAASSLPPVSPTSSPVAEPSPVLSSYLSSSFAPLAASGFAPLEEIRAEALANGEHVETDLPTSAEEVANQPSLEETLDIDAVEGGKPVVKEKEEKKGWWSDDYAPVSAEEQKKIGETVQSAGAQADGFKAKGFEEADRIGEDAAQPAKASEQSLTPGEEKEAERIQKDERAAAPASTSSISESAAPLGSYLSTSFTTSSLPSPSTAGFPSDSSLETADQLVNTKLTSGTVRSAGAQGDAFVGKSYTEADKSGVVPEDKIEETKTHGNNALGTYLTTHFAAAGAGAESADASEGRVSSQEGSKDAAPSSSSPNGAAKKSTQESEEDIEEIPRADTKKDGDEGDKQEEKDAPSLTLSIFSAWHSAPWSRKIWAVLASVAINVGLPFVNGVMLGFGELFARNVLGVRLGWPLHSSSPTVPASGRANTAGVGLRSAGVAPSSSSPSGRIGTETPGHAGAKTALEAVVEGAAQA